MNIILLERIARLGQVGDVVRVKDGYARNFLLPKGKALRATDANKVDFESRRADIEARNLDLQKEASAVAERLDGQTAVAVRRAGATGQLYGSVNSRDIVVALDEIGFKVERSQILLNQPIKKVGLHPVIVALFADINATILMNVARSDEEAERQAKGEDITSTQDDVVTEDEVVGLDDVFEEGAEPVAGTDEESNSEESEDIVSEDNEDNSKEG